MTTTNHRGCSFCGDGHPTRQPGFIVRGPDATICDWCIAICVYMMSEGLRRREGDGNWAARLGADLAAAGDIETDTIREHLMAQQAKPDPRPACIRCGERWVPAEGIDATVTSCGECSEPTPEELGEPLTREDLASLSDDGEDIPDPGVSVTMTGEPVGDERLARGAWAIAHHDPTDQGALERYALARLEWARNLGREEGRRERAEMQGGSRCCWASC